jgi:hypothetical protein
MKSEAAPLYAYRVGGERESCDTGRRSSYRPKPGSESADVTRAIGGSIGGSCDELDERGRLSGLGDISGLGKTSWAIKGCSGIGTESHELGWSGRGEVGFEGPRLWKRRCDSILDGC